MDEESKKMFQNLLSGAVDLGQIDLLREIKRVAKELEVVAEEALKGAREKISMIDAAIKEIEDKDQIKIDFPKGIDDAWDKEETKGIDWDD